MRALLLLLLPGCFAVTDLDRFQKSSGGGSDQFYDLKLTVRAMTSHVNEKFEYRIIDANNVIQSRGYVKPLGGEAASIFAPRSIPRINGPYRIDFYADHNNSGDYDGTPDPFDHAWRVDAVDFGAVDNDDGTVTIVFDHNRSFTELNEFPKGTVKPPSDTGVPCVIRMTNMGGYTGKLVQVRVVDAGSRYLVGLYRVPAISEPAFELKIPGIIDAGVAYDVEIYVDANGNGVYELGTDHGWRIRRPTDRTTGLVLDFDPNAYPDKGVDVGPP